MGKYEAYYGPGQDARGDEPALKQSDAPRNVLEATVDVGSFAIDSRIVTGVEGSYTETASKGK